MMEGSRTMQWCIVAFSLLQGALTVPATWKQCGYEKWNDLQLRVLQPGVKETEVDKLFVSQCGVTVLKPGSLDNIPNVEFINFEHNFFENISADVFNTPKLKMLSLFNNKIIGDKISPQAFKRCNLRFIDFGKNNMSRARRDLFLGKDLETLLLTSCFLEKIPEFVTNAFMINLECLDLSFNKIKRLDNVYALDSVPNLEVLNLRNNNIEYINEEVFAPLNTLIEVHLDKNMLRYLPEKLFQNKIGLYTIGLADNLLEYISPNAFERTNLRELDLSNNKLYSLPNNFLSADVKLRKFNFLGNPWKCSELYKLIAEVRVKNIKHSENKLTEQMCLISRFEKYVENNIIKINSTKHHYKT